MITAFDIVSSVLKKLFESGVLQEFMLIGSWCLPVYQDYFDNSPMIPVLRTTDIDFMIPYPPSIKIHADIPGLLATLGFSEEVDAFNNVIKFIHPDLEIEFVIPEVGPTKTRNPWIPELKVLPQRLRFLSILQSNPLQSNFKGIPVTVPEPAAFVIQKFICSAERKKIEKKENDLRIATEIGSFLLLNQQQAHKLNEIFGALVPKWRKRFIQILKTDAPKFLESFPEK